MTKEQWEQEVKTVVDGYLERKDGHFDDTMCAHYHSCDYEEQSIAIEFTTQAWQRNERDSSMAAPLPVCLIRPAG